MTRRGASYSTIRKTFLTTFNNTHPVCAADSKQPSPVQMMVCVFDYYHATHKGKTKKYVCFCFPTNSHLKPPSLNVFSCFFLKESHSIPIFHTASIPSLGFAINQSLSSKWQHLTANKKQASTDTPKL